jgi:hemerythrin superfamily protein
MSAFSRYQPAAVVTDAIALLKHDNALIAALFAEFELAGEQQVDPLARRICKMLRVHMQIEEDLFYPVARASVAESALVDEIAAQHATVEQSIMLIESLTSVQPAFAEAIATLNACMREHMEAEERVLFPRVAASKVNLVALGLALVERRDSLMRALGLTDDDDIPALRQLMEGDDARPRRLASVAGGDRDTIRGPGPPDARRYRER